MLASQRPLFCRRCRRRRRCRHRRRLELRLKSTRIFIKFRLVSGRKWAWKWWRSIEIVWQRVKYKTMNEWAKLNFFPHQSFDRFVVVIVLLNTTCCVLPFLSAPSIDGGGGGEETNKHKCTVVQQPEPSFYVGIMRAGSLNKCLGT